jgi:hypothetical protein
MDMVAVREDAGVKLVKLDVACLEACDRTRVRAHKPNENSDIIHEYAEAYECGLMLDPLDVFCEKGTERYIVADGEHRLLALRRAKIKEVSVRLHEGDEIDALDFALGCNHAHGLRRTKADKMHAFKRIMETPTLRDRYRTDTDLSERIGVAKRTIAGYKVEWRNSEGGNKSARKAKTAAKENAEKKTRTDLKVVPTKPLTQEQKKVAKEVRESTKRDEDTGWTKADETSAEVILDAVATLGKAWNAATRAAQIHTRDVIRDALKGMQ